MTDLLLGVIAASVLIMAVLQVLVVAFTARTVRRVSDTVARLERDVRPIVSDLQAMVAETARAAGLAAAQVERADRVLADLTLRLDASLSSLQQRLLRPAREGMAVLYGLKAAFAVMREWRDASARGRTAPAEEEDPLFIG